VLRSRTLTTGIHETRFLMGQLDIQLVVADVVRGEDSGIRCPDL